MVERDIQEFLKTGSWTTSRAKSPARQNSPTRSDHVPSRTSNTPVRANQSSKLDPHVPRSFNLGLHKSRFPPPPSVEDEVESLAREHGSTIASGTSDEDPKFPGDVEQFPILQEVHEFNPERRFVLVSDAKPGSDTASADESTGKRKGKEEYEANTCRKFVITSDDEKDKDRGKRPRPGLEKRKSRQDLPRIDTGLPLDQDLPASSGRNRSRSATYTQNPAQEYFDRPREPQTAGDGYLSPVITSKYSSKGRERAYYDTNGGSGRNRAPSSDRRGPPHDDKHRADRGTHSLDPPAHKRSPSFTDSPRSERRRAADPRYRDEVSSSRAARNGSPPRTKRRDSSPSAPRVRKSNSPPYPQSARDRQKLPGRSPSFNKGRRRSPDEDEDSEVDFPRVQRPNRRRESVVHQEDRAGLLSPDQGRPPRPAGPRSRGSTPLASPRIVQNQFPEPELGTSPRNAATFPYVKDGRRVDERPIPSLATAESAPTKAKPRMDDDLDSPRGGRSRASSLLKAATIAAPLAAMALPILIPGETSSPVDRRGKSPMPPPHGRQTSLPEGSPPKQGHWQPAPFNPTEQRATLDKPVLSYRRYSEDVQQGVIKALPECPRTAATTGCYDWLTLPQSRNFDICPDCYQSTFANTQFKHSFVPAPLRGADMPVSCDFGSSHWYRVAWLMTVKYGIPNLRLLKAIAAVGVKHQACSGSREASRIWSSSPTSTACSSSSTRPPYPRGACATCHFTPGRKRFLKIFDLLESTSDAALSRRTPPDLQRLADQIRDLTITPECMRDEPIANNKWHVMESIPEFTVCEECFDDVVLPIVEGEGGSVARNFFKRRQERPVATCQLYSDRMRDIFRKACRRDDIAYLDDRVKERLDVEASIKAKLAEGPGEEETRELLKEWQKWE
ncbi:hypothetical protein GE09DRAFT_1056836 [Coniochaeta sp. 2T2.1]|nr:hypothetical protein GE09DRAFT_1056836 [Coniochaeta sp. 2T2.1]